MTRQKRRVILTFVVAGAAAVIGEHLFKPTMKRRLKV